MRKKTRNLLSLPAVYLSQGITGSNSAFDQLRGLFGGKPNSAAGATTAGDLILAIVNILLLLAGGVAVIFLIIGGYKYVVSRGNEEATESAKKTMSSAVMGIIVITLAFAIVAIVANVLQGNTGIP